MSGKTVKHRTDNRNVVYVLSSSSKKSDLQKLVCDIFKLCLENNIQLHPEWIPRSDNLISDWFSKDIDKDDYMLNPEIVYTDCVHKFESPEHILFLLDCTNPIEPTRNVKYHVFPFVPIIREL